MSDASTAIYTVSEIDSVFEFMDRMKVRRQANDLEQSEAVWRREVNFQIDRYNKLLAQANAFGDKARKMVAEQDERIFKLREAKNELAAENERLRLRLLDAEGDLAIMRQLDRDQHPEFYQNQP